MNIHEFQAKSLFRDYGMPVPDGRLVLSPEEARIAALDLGCPVVVKAQIHAGGRGKAGGVKRAQNPEEAETIARELLGRTLHTKQTGSQGKVVRKLLVERATEIKREFYLSMTVDADNDTIAVAASGAGGMEIEEVAARSPEKIAKTRIDIDSGFRRFKAYGLAGEIGMPSELKKQFAEIVGNLYDLFIAKDCAMAEINPLVVAENNALLALDAKLSFDSNALFRHPDISAMRDRNEELPLEARAFDSGMNYVSLGGQIGCFVIGAGMAMATMDAIKAYGEEPANFLDCGSKTSSADAEEAFNIILAECGAKGILVNIFGGITQLDSIAEGIVLAMRKNAVSIPVVARLEGTNGDLANEILKSSGLGITLASSLTGGVENIVRLVREREANVG